MVIGVLFFWLALSVIVGVAANTRGQNPIGWFFLSILFSPILAGLLVLALPNYGRLSLAQMMPRFGATSLWIE
jgi:type IV secretory pathway protease TraF